MLHPPYTRFAVLLLFNCRSTPSEYSARILVYPSVCRALGLDKHHGCDDARGIALRHLDLDLQSHIRSIPDFPKPGILFRDINPMLRSPEAMAEVIRQLGAFCDQVKPDLIVGIESRGFIFGAPLASDRRLGFVPVRKPGKLPGEVVGLDYALEYGTDRLEIQADAFEDSPRVLVVDDLLATGGTAAATGQLVEQAGGCLVGFAFVIELEGLGGRQALPAGQPVEALLRYG